MPYPKDHRLDVHEVIEKGEFNGRLFLPVLQALSQLGIEQVKKIDFLTTGILPDPEDPTFPEYALGLILILDQAPRTVFKGVDTRYSYSFFGPMAIKLIRRLKDLPPHLVPYNRDRWVRELGYPIDHWFFALFWFMAPITHSELLVDQEYQVTIWDSAKKDNMKINHGLSDPYAEALKGELGRDVLAFAREVEKGLPTEEELGRPLSFGDYVYWFAMIFHIHLPIIDKFGRYPYRNGAVGRDTTEEEKDFLVKTGYWSCVDEEVAEKIREDLEKGVWSPLNTTAD